MRGSPARSLSLLTFFFYFCWLLLLVFCLIIHMKSPSQIPLGGAKRWSGESVKWNYINSEIKVEIC